MGMFDTFIDKKCTIECSCGAKFDLSNGIQSKLFNSDLSTYEVGDVVDDLNKNKKVVEEHDWCMKCDKDYPIFLGFHKSIFVGCFDTYNSAVEASNNFDYTHFYIKHYKNNTKHKMMLDDVVYKIKQTIKIHNAKPNIKNFGIMFNIGSYDFIDFDLLQTLKNIIKKTI